MPIIEATPVMIGDKRIGGEKATIATSVFAKSAESFMSRFSDGSYPKSYLYEIRYDLFQERSVENLRELLSFLNSQDIDFIFTFRFTERSDGIRMYNTAVEMNAPAIDIDISGMTGISFDSYKGTRIISSHDYEGRRISHMLNGMAKLDGDIYKLASNYTDMHAFLLDMSDLCTVKENLKVPLVFVPMGKKNSALRLFSGFMLSDIVYAGTEKTTADGQLTRKEYEDFFKRF